MCLGNVFFQCFPLIVWMHTYSRMEIVFFQKFEGIAPWSSSIALEKSKATLMSDCFKEPLLCLWKHVGASLYHHYTEILRSKALTFHLLSSLWKALSRPFQPGNTCSLNWQKIFKLSYGWFLPLRVLFSEIPVSKSLTVFLPLFSFWLYFLDISAISFFFSFQASFSLQLFLISRSLFVVVLFISFPLKAEPETKACLW